ncbi:MAG TPA: amidohydrolase family protein [Myxococcales bacterium]|nr:amidohydrolase family protein [Myxococcales bacterium]
MRILAVPTIALAIACSSSSAQVPHKTAAEETQAPVLPTRTWVQQRAVVLRHARVLTAAGPAIEDGAVAFAQGKIIAAGPDGSVQTPPGAEEIDAKGMVVTPGIIDAHSHLGVYPSPQTQGNSDGNEATNPITAEVNAKDGFWPQDPGLRRAAAGGITSLLILPGSANLIGGRGFPVKLHFGRTADEMRFPGAKDALKMACGENPKRVYGRQQHRAPSTRMGDIAEFRKAFAAAKDYERKQERWKEKQQGEPPARDLRNETLVAAMKGEILVQNHCYRADEMQLMMDVAREFGFHIRAFHHAVEAYKLRDVLAKEGVGIATWADWWGGKMEMWDGIPQNLALLEEAGVRAMVHSDSEQGIQRLNQEAGKAMAAARGVGIHVRDEQAIRWLTLNPAWAMGVDDRTGSLEPGKMADVVLWDRTPFSVYARAQRVWADGVITYDARTGATVPSDFELGEPLRTAALQTPHPGRMPELPSTTPQPLAVEDAPCTDIRGAVGLDGKPVTVTLREGKISLTPIPGCRVIDTRGRILTPGFILPYGQLGLVEVSQEESANDIGSTRRPPGAPAERVERPVHAAMRAADSVNPLSELLPVAGGGGVTSAVTSPGGGVVSGQALWFSMDGSILRTPLAVQVRLGLEAKEATSAPRGYSIALLRELLDDAREYGRRQKDFDQNRMRLLTGSRADLAAMQPVLQGKLPLLIHADRTSDLRAAIAIGKEYGARVILSGVAEGWLMANELAAAKTPVILTATQDLPETFDALASRSDNAALLAAAGVKVMIAPEQSAHFARTLRQEAGNAVAFGLPWDEAMRAITSNVADAFGLDGGRIAEGARGDVVLWDGDPLEVSSQPVAIWIAGRQLPLQSRQTALLRKYRKVP